MQQTYSIKLEEKQIAALENLLNTLGFQSVGVKSQYEIWRAVLGSTTCVMYGSGKFVAQGSDLSEIKNQLEKLISGKEDSSNLADFAPRVGADEVGKGDYFGPLVVAAAYLTSESAQFAKSLGVGDSKKISDPKIIEIFNELIPAIKYRVQVISPEIYNDLYSDIKNVSIMLSKLHAKNIELLLAELKEEELPCEVVVIDQFSQNKGRLLSELGPLTKECEFRQFHKGESDLAVAAGSIIARATFLNAWSAMENEWDFTFPKGATSVIDAGKRFIARHGEENLKNVAKISFKTTLDVVK